MNEYLCGMLKNWAARAKTLTKAGGENEAQRLQACVEDVLGAFNRGGREKHLKGVLRDRAYKVPRPSFKATEVIPKYAVLYVDRETPGIYDTLHLVDAYREMVEYEVYRAVRVYDLDSGALLVDKRKDYRWGG